MFYRLKNEQIENPNSIYHILFSDIGIKDKETLEDFIKKRINGARMYYETNNGLNLKLTQEQVKKDFMYIKKKEKEFTEFMLKKQDEMYNMALELAEKGDKNYRIYLNKFIVMTINYSKILDENNEDITQMLGCINPDAYIFMNQIYKEKGKKTLPLYEFYKNDIPEIARAVLDVKLAYTKARKKEK